MLVLRSNSAFETGSGDARAKRTSSDWGSVSLSRTGSPTKDSNPGRLSTRRSSEDSGGSWLRPAAASGFHSRTGSILSDWGDSEGIQRPLKQGMLAAADITECYLEGGTHSCHIPRVIQKSVGCR